MDSEMTMMWNAILSLIVAPMTIIIVAQVREIRRIDILLNRTREELGKDYVTRQEMDNVMDRVMEAIDRLSQKVDRLFEERNN
jgi:division protein CdvB (Snf7/Vps24/ESCRT-III family)